MTSIWSVILVAGLAGTAAADKMKPGHYPEKAASWKKYTLGDVALGTELTKLSGFTCARKRCVKFIDARCAGRPTKLQDSDQSAPKGKACIKDAGSHATFLDGKYQVTPLEYIAVEGTDTDTPIVHTIDQTTPLQEVSATSAFVTTTSHRLGAQPVNKQYNHAPFEAVWLEGDVQISIGCAEEVAPRGQFCTVSAHDFKLEEVERSIQEAFDEEHKP